jgi:hypothetical protein
MRYSSVHRLAGRAGRQPFVRSSWRWLFCALPISVAALAATARAEEIDIDAPAAAIQPAIVVANDDDGLITILDFGMAFLPFAGLPPELAWQLQLIAGGADQVEALRPWLRSELAFARTICGDLTTEQRMTIYASGATALRKAVRQIERYQQASGNEPIPRPDALAVIRQGVADGLQQAVSPELMDHFTQELRHRLERRKHAAMMTFIASVDRIMFLSHEQRDELLATLSTSWQSSWENWYYFDDLNGLSLPDVDEALLKCLSDEQRTIWKHATRTQLDLSSCESSAIDEDDWWRGASRDLTPLLLQEAHVLWRWLTVTGPAARAVQQRDADSE